MVKRSIEMKELIQRLMEDLVGVKLTPEEIDNVAQRFEEMVEANKRVNEMPIADEEPMVIFSRERKP